MIKLLPWGGEEKNKKKSEARATAKWKTQLATKPVKKSQRQYDFPTGHGWSRFLQRKIRVGTPAVRTKAKVARRLFTASTKTRLAIKVSHLPSSRPRRKHMGRKICLYKSNLDGLWVNPGHSIPAWKKNKQKNEGFRRRMLKFCTRYVPFAVTNEKRKGGRGRWASLHSFVLTTAPASPQPPWWPLTLNTLPLGQQHPWWTKPRMEPPRTRGVDEESYLLQTCLFSPQYDGQFLSYGIENG